MRKPQSCWETLSLDRRINKSLRHVLSTVSDALKLLLYLVSVIVPWAFFKMLGPLRGALERQTSIKNHRSIPEAWKGGHAHSKGFLVANLC